MSNFLAENLRSIHQRIKIAAARAGRARQDVTLVAVTKTATSQQIVEALASGITHLGENRIQDAAVKIPQLLFSSDAKVCWHMIGHLQSNKVNKAVTLFDRIDSVDRWEIVEALDRRLGVIKKDMEALLEVKLSEEPNKSGLPSADVMGAVRRWGQIKHIKLRGLMTIAPLGEDSSKARSAFRKLRNLFDAINASKALPDRLDVLSMGMTDDFEIAVEEGSTEVRIGRALFSPRGNP